MILLTHSRNATGLTFDIAKQISSHRHRTPHSTTPSILFKSISPPLGYEKSNKKPMNEFLWRNICCCIEIKDFLPKIANNQSISTEDMIFKIWSKEAMKQRRFHLQQ